MLPAAGPSGTPLPELRADLQVVAAERGGIVVLDPVRRRYFRLDESAGQVLSAWPDCRTIEALAEVVNARFLQFLTVEQVGRFVAFLVANEIAIETGAESWRALDASARRRRHGWASWAIHNYLFIKIPLIRPERMLAGLAVGLSFLYTRTCLVLVAATGLAGLYLVSRQWDEFVATFTGLLSLQGALAFPIAIAVVKSLHELGHGLTAARLGCRVPTAGVCLMVMVPTLYTDVTDAWRLVSRRQRLAISAAGLVVETAIACLATFAWAFAPAGIARDLACALATTSWFMSLGINLNPFMRFDGYYILSDLAGIDNLQPRAFAIGTWRMREVLFALGAPPPEPLARKRLHRLALYAWAVWLYRLLLFIGIAVFVYSIGFKLLGIVLFLVEIVYFVLAPMWSELRQWVHMRAQIWKARRGLVVAAVLLAGVVAALMPISTTVLVPVMLQDRDLTQLYPPRPAFVTAIHVRQGEQVEAGSRLLQLASPDLEHEMALARSRVVLVEKRLARIAGDRTDRTELLVLSETLARLRSALAGLEGERSRLDVVAPVTGTVIETAGEMNVGRWFQRNELMLLISPGRHCAAQGYVSEDHVARVVLPSTGRYVPEIADGGSREVLVDRLAGAGLRALELAALTSPFGGAVSARMVSRPGEPRQIVPLAGQFLLTGEVAGDAPGCVLSREARGTLHLTGRAESLVTRGWRHVVKVLVRESGL